MKRSQVTVAALTNAGWQGPLGKMVSAIHSKTSPAIVQCGQSFDFDFRHAVVDGEVIVSIRRPRQKTFTLCDPSLSKRESFRKTCRSDCE